MNQKTDIKKKKTLAFIIYTYDRYHLLVDLLKSIAREIPDYFKIKVFIFDDHSPQKQIFPEIEFPFHIHYHRFKKNHGRKKWHGMINYIFKYLKTQPQFQYYFFLNDDMEFVEGGIQKAIDLYKSIDHPQKIALNLHCDDRGPNSKWSSRSGKTYNADLWKTGWTDMTFLCQHYLLDELKWSIPRDQFFWIVRNQDCSSGVGFYISKKLADKGKRFFLVKKSLVYHKGSHESKMNPDERKKHPLFTKL